MKNYNMNKLVFCLLTCVVLALSACSTSQTSQSFKQSFNGKNWSAPNDRPYEKLPGIDIDKELVLLSKRIDRLEAKPANADSLIRGLKAFRNGDYIEANFYLQHSLKYDPQNPHLHKMNAISYHLRGDAGDPSQYELAEVGYNLAKQFNPGDSSVSYYQGLLNFKLGRYETAQDYFASAILIDASEPDYYHGLAAASYYIGEVERAYLNIQRALQLAPQNELHVRASGMIYASLGAFDKAEEAASFLDKKPASGFSNVRHLRSRINDWRRYFNTTGLIDDERFQILMAQNTDLFGVPSGGVFGDDDSLSATTSNTPSDSTSVSGSQQGNQQSGVVAKPHMALIDVAIIRTEETYKSVRGVNLLNGLNLFFSNSETNNTLSWGLGTSSNSGLAYSLNIFNDNYDRNEIMARPTIIVQDKELSKFFSGGTTHVVLEGGQAGSGSIEPIKDGVRLEVKPNFLDKDTINIAVIAERTALESSLASVSSQLTGTSFARTANTTISANITLKYGETMVLSGLSDQDKDTVDSKVPLLGDIPAAQYLFRNNVKMTKNKTVLILLTPRRASLTLADGTPIEAEVEVNRQNLVKLEDGVAWLKPASNLRSIVNHLSRYEFFNQYRKGDIMLDSWSKDAWTANTLEKALEYMYIRYDFGTLDGSKTFNFNNS